MEGGPWDDDISSDSDLPLFPGIRDLLRAVKEQQRWDHGHDNGDREAGQPTYGVKRLNLVENKIKLNIIRVWLKSYPVFLCFYLTFLNFFDIL